MNQKLIFVLKVIKRKFLRFDTGRWIIKGFNSPSPQWVKIQLLVKNMLPNCEWIETGTYLGDTTKVLAKNSKAVTSIEPSGELFEFASFRLGSKRNIKLLNGSSEELFHDSLKQSGPRLNIWLDGHFSGDITFQGKTNTPVIYELTAISKELNRFDELKVFIDDVRCFYHDMDEGNDYPKLEYLLNWARANGFRWKIDQDIFILSYKAPLK